MLPDYFEWAIESKLEWTLYREASYYFLYNCSCYLAISFQIELLGNIPPAMQIISYTHIYAPTVSLMEYD